jgi:hypothetical protein
MVKLFYPYINQPLHTFDKFLYLKSVLISPRNYDGKHPALGLPEKCSGIDRRLEPMPIGFTLEIEIPLFRIAFSLSF